MSRTKHHRGQKHQKVGLNFGGKYNHNKFFDGGYGRVAKDAAHIELRQKDKEACREAMDQCDEEIDELVHISSCFDMGRMQKVLSNDLVQPPSGMSKQQMKEFIRNSFEWEE